MNYNIYALNNKTLFDICVVVPSRAYLYGVKSKKKKKRNLTICNDVNGTGGIMLS